MTGEEHRESNECEGKIRHRVLRLSEQAIEFARVVNIGRKCFQRMQPEWIVCLALRFRRFN